MTTEMTMFSKQQKKKQVINMQSLKISQCQRNAKIKVLFTDIKMDG